MRDYITPSEVAAILGKDNSISKYKIWDRLQTGEQGKIGDYGRWQGRLASAIMEGISSDHNLRIQGSVDSTINNSIMPPRLWSVAPCMATNGKPAVLYVGQRQNASMFQWKVPNIIPEKDRLRMLGIATAANCNVVLFGVLIDGYQSSLFVFETNQEERDNLKATIEDFIQTVRDDIEPDLDYVQDANEIKKGQINAKPLEASDEEIESLTKEMKELETELTRLKNTVNKKAKRIDELEATLLHILIKEPKIETKSYIITTESNANGKKSIKIANKNASPLF